MNTLIRTKCLRTFESSSPDKPLNIIPDYAMNSEHSLLCAYKVKPYDGDPEIEPIIILDKVNLEEPYTKMDKIEHAYGLSYPLARSDFVVIDTDERHDSGLSMITMLDMICKWRKAERIDVMVSSMFIADRDTADSIKDYKYFDRCVSLPAFHIYVKFNGTYDCTPAYLTTSTLSRMCPGYFFYGLIHGESTIRISEKFNPEPSRSSLIVRVSDEIRPSVYSRTIQYNSNRLLTKPIKIIEGVRSGSRWDFTHYCEYISERLTEDRVHELLPTEPDKPKPKTKQINLRM